MTMYRKTALVSAEQFLPSEGKIPDGVFSDGLSDPRSSPAEWCLQTLEGRHTLRNGDYICTGPNGEKWNVEQSIFEATYKPAPTPRETADHIGEAIDHAELARRFEALAVEASAARNLDGAESMMVSIQTIYDLIVNRNALLSEIAALRGERDRAKERMHTAIDKARDEEIAAQSAELRTTQAERQRDELRKAVLRAMKFVNLCVDAGEVQPEDAENPADLWGALNATLIANQGADQ